MKKLTLLGLIIVMAFAYVTYRDAFKLSNITMEIPGNEKIVPPLSVEEKQNILAILDQPYRYLAEGNQVYAFISQDDHYVLKFFKFGHLKPALIQPPHSYFVHQENVKQRKLERLFNAHQVAYCHDKEHCGLIYAHLNFTEHFGKIMSLKDKYGISHSVDLDSTFFVLQKKGEPLGKILHRLLKQKNVPLAQKKLHQIIDMYLTEYQRGIFDHDHNIMINVGFSDGEPMRLDVGKIVLDPQYSNPDLYRNDLNKIVNKRIDKWLIKHYPQYHKEIISDLIAQY